MNNFRNKMSFALVAIAVIGLNSSFAQSQTSSLQPDRVSIAYIPPDDVQYQEVYDLLRGHRVLETVQEILSPLRSPEELTIKTTECKEVNSWYKRENFKPTVTICYEFLKRTLESLPSENNPDGVRPADAAVGQFFWVTLHEVGHATFDILDVPIFGHEEDAADNFATYIMLQFGEGQAHRLIAGAAWAWRAYLGDYKRIPSCHCGSAHLGAIMVSPKSVFTIWYVCHLEPTAQDSLTLRIICLRRGRRAAHSNTGPWSGRLRRKFRHILIRKWLGGCWIQIGLSDWKRNHSPRNSARL
jgi:hypothetical protein